MKFKGIVKVTHQAGGSLLGTHETTKAYASVKEALKEAKKLGSEVESQYTAYANMDYETKPSFSKEELDFTNYEVRRAFIENTPSGRYDGLVAGDGKLAVVTVEKGESMVVYALNEKDWYEWIEYDEEGFRMSEGVTKNP